MGIDLKVFFDTWGWLSIADRKEDRHVEVNRWYNEIRLKSGVIYTTDYVLSETITLFFRRLPFNAARHSMERMQESIRAN